MDLLDTSFGASRLIARMGDRRLWILDPPGGVLWDLYATGWDSTALVKLICGRYGLDPVTIRAEIEGLIAKWQKAGLLDEGKQSLSDWCLDSRETSLWPPPFAKRVPDGAKVINVADRVVSLGCDTPVFARIFNAWFNRSWGELAPTSPKLSVQHQFHLNGTEGNWCLECDGFPLKQGNTHDEALVATLSALTELGSRPVERLIVIHGAGLVAPDGHGLLLIAPGGSGKTTLATALNAQGYGLLSDDVVPVSLDGALLGLGLPLCLKSGGWPVLRVTRPELNETPVVMRFGQRVRYLPHHTPAPVRPVAPALLLFTRYQPNSEPQAISLRPEQALQSMINAEAVLRDLTQAKIEALARWVSNLPAYSLTYPDLDSGMAWVQSLLAQIVVPGGSCGQC